jgi:hypothetical protein
MILFARKSALVYQYFVGIDLKYFRRQNKAIKINTIIPTMNPPRKYGNPVLLEPVMTTAAIPNASKLAPRSPNIAVNIRYLFNACWRPSSVTFQ